jgi:hypothetical protein
MITSLTLEEEEKKRKIEEDELKDEDDKLNDLLTHIDTKRLIWGLGLGKSTKRKTTKLTQNFGW